jgi:TPR repeat protein
LGKFYSHDCKDLATARTWYDKAAAQEHPLALQEIGYLLHTRRASEMDRKRGLECYTKSAEAGFALAQLNIGISLLWDQGNSFNILIPLWCASFLYVE